MLKADQSILRVCANLAIRRPWAMLGVALVLTVLAGWAASHLTINTSTDDILSSKLRFRQVEAAYDKAFPQEDMAIVVIDAPTSDEASAAGRNLLSLLQDRPDVFESVDLAGASPYFDRNGLLFLEPDQIADIAQQLRPARLLLTTLANDPSLRGAASILSMAEEGATQAAAPPETAQLLGLLAQTVGAQAQGQDMEMPWAELFESGGLPGRERQVLEVKPVLDNSSINRAGAAIDALRDAFDEVGADYPEVTFRLTGEPVLRQQELNDALSGAVRASILSLILVSTILTIGIRSARMIGALLISLVIGAIWTAGLAAVAVGQLNLISIAFMVLFFGLGIDFGTHLGLRHLEAARGGEPFDEALRHAMSGEWPSISLSALCAALAFLSFVPTSYVGLAEFGIISALGMLVALVITFTLLPALMSIMRPRPSQKALRTLGIGPLINRHYRAVLILAVVVTVGALFVAPEAQIDTNPLNLQNPNTESVETYRDLANTPETSPYALNVLAPNLEAARELTPQLAALEGVAGVMSIDSFVPQDQDAKLAALEAARQRVGDSFFAERADDPPNDAELQDAYSAMLASAQAIATVPDDIPVDPGIKTAGGQLEQALQGFGTARGTDPGELSELGSALTDQMPPLVADLRMKLSVSEPVTVDDVPEEIRKDWIAEDGQVRLRVLPEGDLPSADAMLAFAETVRTVAPDAAGAPAAITAAGQAVLLSFVEAIAYTVIAIGLVVTIVRRRLADVLLVLAPLAVASIWVVAGSALLDVPFNFANVIVIPLLIGLGVASSIHMVARAREEENAARDGSGQEKSGVLSTSTPLAVLITQLNTVAAFATLAVAEHRGLFSMGVLLGLAIFFVLIVSLIALPSFMAAIGIGRRTASG
jgi:hopanoid biosynthesis associated RND transporter like protein HpnN